MHMKEIDVYRLMRRDVITGNTSTHELDSANSKNRYSILADVNIKGGNVPPVKSVLIEQCTDSSIFLEFIRMLLESGVLLHIIYAVLTLKRRNSYSENTKCTAETALKF